MNHDTSSLFLRKAEPQLNDSSAELFMHVFKSSGCLRSEASYRRSHPLDGFWRSAYMCFTEKFVGVAYEPLKRVARAQVVAWVGEACRHYVCTGEPGAGVSFGHGCRPFRRSAFSEHFCAYDAMRQIRFRPETQYARSIGAADADVVQHGGIFYMLRRDFEAQAPRNSEGHIGDLPAMALKYLA